MTPPDFRKAVEARLEGLTPRRRELRALRDAHERLREELVAEQERARKMEQELRDEQRRLAGARDKYKAERDEIAARLQAVQESQSFRVGHAVVRAARFPLVLARRLARLTVRGVRWILRRIVRPTGRGIAAAVRATGRSIRAIPARAKRLVLRAGRALRGLRPSRPAPASAPAQGAAAKAPAAGTTTAPAPGTAAANEAERVLGVPQGNKFLGPLTDGHATTMFLLWGLSNDELDSLVDEVARLQLMQWDFKPLFVTDSDYWDCFLEHGYWFEYIPEAEDWISHNDGRDWSQFVSERVDSIVEAYSPDRIVVYEDAAKRGALRRGVLNGIISAGDPVVEVTRPRS